MVIQILFTSVLIVWLLLLSILWVKHFLIKEVNEYDLFPLTIMWWVFVTVYAFIY